MRGAEHFDAVPVAASSRRWSIDRHAATEECPSQAPFVLGDIVDGADGDQFTTPDSGSRSEIDQRVCSSHRVFVVLDHDQCIAQVSQAFERLEQFVVIPRVQSDRWFIEHVKHADQPSPDLACQSNPLRFPSRERWGSPLERKVPQSYVDQELETQPNFFDRFLGDDGLGILKLDL